MEKIFFVNGEEIKVQDYLQKDDVVSFSMKGKVYRYQLVTKDGAELVLDSGSRFKANVSSISKEGESVVMALGREAILSTGAKKVRKETSHSGGLASPMPGKIFKILKEVGSVVKKGDPILVLEAMKMEHSIRSDKDGTVKRIPFKVGELVQGGVLLAEVE
jgi:biotin carboxyl carrier protein